MKISFGTLFKVDKKVTRGKNRTGVVVDVGEEDHFQAAQIFKSEGKIAFSFPTGVGTARPEDIDLITGQLTLQEMLAAARLGLLKKMGRELDEEEKASLEGYATGGEREI
ncbi:MAG: hypothetical protein UX99_C0028G0016 [Candidatus Amesbacteria bacterium GW2011_GWB1_47_26]|uniref:Uncharacterized protein n=1 Tax=Candidatus Amesbacteria bacterium GW2011_GWC2_45_19 TaxID=1618366 RepID=A0A0G1Q3R5_9BACT|nr:MAG: hypothetical protein UX05_C0002G0081 [Candidatus Amesbacteria bacterium GW2011_GWC2_45_19]KKU38008.1 MAG: hypothetical protein UX52_C0012G0006 [Candidatus Amesbacteria bacterium GW2011_GWA1_46_35]KKU68954.1 MAG: hypothetical protein UX93_C0004G0025 [Microgenomates group bacterium GW2011_GWC1_47_20]KKU73618.1 MAG: hypothetical protein UX99_C0028G0016 [Candidatus Amesbacteria bacterium GW2011_GWB1_47_26]KKU78802.1 MAG: hypothetical protein UY06_C0039G0002 [Candidatus Amesbacteria bacteriu